jgi:hypothetical protein
MNKKTPPLARGETAGPEQRRGRLFEPAACNSVFDFDLTTVVFRVHSFARQFCEVFQHAAFARSNTAGRWFIASGAKPIIAG